MNDPFYQQPFALQQNVTSLLPSSSNRYILTGSFRSPSLALLAFSPSVRTLSWVKTIPGDSGPHQFLAKVDYKRECDGRGLGESEESGTRCCSIKEWRVYGTSWALPPMLHCWGLKRETELDGWTVWNVGQTPINAVSSYINVPHPFTYIYSTGGPSGEVHRVDQKTGGFGEKVQEFLFVKEDELERADKTKVALRYGSHGIEFTPDFQYAFVPVLGTDTIEMYAADSVNGKLTHISSVHSIRKGKDQGQVKDGPRHVKVHPNGRVVYCVTEHSNLVDSYYILPDGTGLEHISTRSLLPSDLSSSTHHFRGDTLMLSPSSSVSPDFIMTTTRGSTPDTRGWLSIFALDEEGKFRDEDGVRYETPTSGGKANAIDLLTKKDGVGIWILLTDDDELNAAVGCRGAVRVLEWDGLETGGVKVVAEWPADESDKEKICGASHAIWLD